MMSTHPDRRFTQAIQHHRYLILAILVFVGLTIRLHGIGRMNFWYDEVLLWEYSLTGHPLYTPTEPPLMAWLLYILMWWAKSADTFFLHFLPVVFGSLVVVSAFVLAQRACGSARVGLLAGLLTSLSPMAIYYAREGRPYALLMLTSTAIYASFIWATETNHPMAWRAYTVLFFLGGLSHLLITQIAAVLGLSSLALLLIPRFSRLGWDVRVQQFRKFLLCTGAAGLAGTLWFVYRYFTDPAIQANRKSIFQSGMYEYGIVTFLRDALANLGAGPFGSRVGILRFGFAEFLALLFLSLFLIGLWRLYKRGKEGISLLFALAVVVPLLIDYLTLGGKGNWDWMRWISHALVPFVVMISIGMQSVLDIAKSPSVRALLCIGFVGSLVPGIVNLSERPDYQSNRDIAEYLKENVRNLNGVLILPALPDIPSPADNRIMDTYYYLKKETLPVYLVSFGKIRTPVFVPSRGDITGVPRERDDWESTLESGRYAVLSRVPIKDCAKIPPWLKDLKAVARQSAPILPGLTVCEVDFFSDPIF